MPPSHRARLLIQTQNHQQKHDPCYGHETQKSCDRPASRAYPLVCDFVLFIGEKYKSRDHPPNLFCDFDWLIGVDFGWLIGLCFVGENFRGGSQRIASFYIPAPPLRLSTKNLCKQISGQSPKNCDNHAQYAVRFHVTQNEAQSRYQSTLNSNRK